MPLQLTVVGRQDCELCEQMLAQLAALGRTHRLPQVRFADIDEDADLAQRFFLDIPVLLLDGEVVCMHRLDRAALLQRLT